MGIVRWNEIPISNGTHMNDIVMMKVSMGPVFFIWTIQAHRIENSLSITVVAANATAAAAAAAKDKHKRFTALSIGDEISTRHNT